MAKRQRVEADSEVTAPANVASRSLDPLHFALGILSGAIVYVMYHPSDSVAVEKGDALWFCLMCLIVGCITWATQVWRGFEPSTKVDRVLDIGPWVLAIWMMVAAFATSPPGNLRMATNEAWLWIAGAALFTSARRIFTSLSARKAVMVLLVVCSTGLAVHGLHQYFISLPAHQAEYREDPESVLAKAGIDAPPGSAERMVFANRLFDGGPTGTFALANSFAAVLLVGLLLSSGVLRFRWSDFGWMQRLLWLAPILICGAALLGTRSRSALLASFIGLALLLVFSSKFAGSEDPAQRRRRTRSLLYGIGGVSLVGGLIAIVVALFGNKEWFEEAPASLAVRFQYWRSTWHMVLDRPLFGSGPGNFQAIYERYREASTTEQIAEPHNFLVETLAGGGFVALAGLLVIAAAGVFRLGWRSESDALVNESTTEDDADKWVWLGAMLALLLVWLMGWASRRVPDLGASVYVVPIALGFAFGLSRVANRVLPSDQRDFDRILAAAICGLTIHLLVSGGWTVPGVALLAWLGGGLLTRFGESPSVGNAPSRRGLWLTIAIGVGLISMFTLKSFSIDPVDRRMLLMETMASAQSSGQLGKARKTLERAVEVDQHSPEAVLWMADYQRWRLIMQGDQPSTRDAWESWLAEAKRRGGEDPAVYRMIGAQQLHVYQCRGNQRDLVAARETFEDAARWSPSHQWMIAQLAVILAAEGDKDRASQLADRATELSELGGNIERELKRQQLYVPEKLGRMAERGPVRRPASELLPGSNQ